MRSYKPNKQINNMEIKIFGKFSVLCLSLALATNEQDYGEKKKRRHFIRQVSSAMGKASSWFKNLFGLEKLI